MEAASLDAAPHPNRNASTGTDKSGTQPMADEQLPAVAPGLGSARAPPSRRSCAWAGAQFPRPTPKMHVAHTCLHTIVPTHQ
jgi:hypothetical protein